MDEILKVLDQHPDLKTKKERWLYPDYSRKYKVTPLTAFIWFFYNTSLTLRNPEDKRLAKHIIKRMIADGADPHDRTVLYAASRVRGHPNLLKMLLRMKGGRPGFKAAKDAIFFSARRPYRYREDIARLFIDAGAGPSINLIQKRPLLFEQYKKIYNNSATKIQAAVRGHLSRRANPTINNIRKKRQVSQELSFAPPGHGHPSFSGGRNYQILKGKWNNRFK
jgi:hypothetical protein